MQRAIRLDYSPAIAVTRLGRITRGGGDTGFRRQRLLANGILESHELALRGRAIKKDLKTTIASRRQVLRS